MTHSPEKNGPHLPDDHRAPDIIDRLRGQKTPMGTFRSTKSCSESNEQSDPTASLLERYMRKDTTSRRFWVEKNAVTFLLGNRKGISSPLRYISASKWFQTTFGDITLRFHPARERENRGPDRGRNACHDRKVVEGTDQLEGGTDNWGNQVQLSSHLFHH